MKKLLFICISCCLSIPLFAEGITNQELLEACKDPSSDSQNFCYGFIISAANAAQFYRNIVDTESKYVDICFPKNITNKEIMELYIGWVEKNPSTATSPAFLGVSSSFSTKYSCPVNREAKKAEIVK